MNKFPLLSWYFHQSANNIFSQMTYKCPQSPAQNTPGIEKILLSSLRVILEHEDSNYSLPSQQLCHVNYTSSCYIATVKQSWVWLVLRWASAWKHRMLLAHKTESCIKNWKWQRCNDHRGACPNAHH